MQDPIKYDIPILSKFYLLVVSPTIFLWDINLDVNTE